MLDRIEEIRDKHNYECSKSVVRKAEQIHKKKLIKIVSPMDARGIHFHICPTIKDRSKKGYDVIYLHYKDEWICDCKHEVFRVDRESICSHILASLFLWEVLKE